MKRFPALAALLTLFLSAAPALADGPEGTWSWVSPLHGRYEDTLTLRLDSEGPTLAGVFVDGLTGRETRIAPSVWHDAVRKVAFAVPCSLNGQSLVLTYTGTLREDTIVGTCQIELNRQIRAIDWVAGRRK